MEKSQWDLKMVQFGGKKVGRMDEFVQQYEQIHSALLRDHEDSLKISKMAAHLPFDSPFLLVEFYDQSSS